MFYVCCNSNPWIVTLRRHRSSDSPASTERVYGIYDVIMIASRNKDFPLHCVKAFYVAHTPTYTTCFFSKINPYRE